MAKVSTHEMINHDVKSTLIKLSWPIILGMIIQSTFNLVDTYFLGKLGSNALAAMSVAFPVIFITMALAVGIGVGVNSLISRKIGANDTKGAQNVAEHGYFLIFLIYILILIFTYTFMENLFLKIGATPEILILVMEYSKTYFIGSFFLFFTFLSNNILRAEGDTRTPLKVMIIAGILNMILDPMFIFGFKFIPSLGVSGASLATVISRVFASIILVYILFIKEKRFDLKNFKYKPEIVRNIFRIGIPASLNQVLVSIMLAVSNNLLAPSGPVALAALGIMMRIESFIFMPLSGLATGVTTMCGHNFGSKKHSRIDKIVKESTKIGIIFIIFVSIIILLKGKLIMSIFSSDINVINLGNSFFRIAIMGYYLLPFIFMTNSAMQGMGKGLFALVTQAIRTVLVALPFAILFVKFLNMDIIYVMYSFLIANIASLITAFFWYYKGKWRKKLFIKEE